MSFYVMKIRYKFNKLCNIFQFPYEKNPKDWPYKLYFFNSVPHSSYYFDRIFLHQKCRICLNDIEELAGEKQS